MCFKLYLVFFHIIMSEVNIRGKTDSLEVLETINNNIVVNSGRITNNQTTINDNVNRLTTNEGNISSNTSSIGNNSNLIDNNINRLNNAESNINSNTISISSLNTDVNTNTNGISSLVSLNNSLYNNLDVITGGYFTISSNNGVIITNNNTDRADIMFGSDGSNVVKNLYISTREMVNSAPVQNFLLNIENDLVNNNKTINIENGDLKVNNGNIKIDGGRYMEFGTGNSGFKLNTDSGGQNGGARWNLSSNDATLQFIPQLTFYQHNQNPTTQNFSGFFGGNFYFSNHIWASGYSTHSDDRLKHNEVEVKGILDDLLDVKVYTYDKTTEMKDEKFNGNVSSSVKETGVIAQELEKIQVFKDLVVKGDTKTPYSVDYRGLFCFALQGLQELIKEVDVMKQRIEVLEQKN